MSEEKKTSHPWALRALGLAVLFFAAYRLIDSNGSSSDEPTYYEFDEFDDEEEPVALVNTSFLLDRPPKRAITHDPFRPYPVILVEQPEEEPENDKPSIDASRFDLQALALGSGAPFALINGKIVGIGDEILGATVRVIDREGVELRAFGSTLWLRPQLLESNDAALDGDQGS